MNQHDKIIDMLKGGDWVCQRTFWDNYMRSPHKRRAEVEKQTGRTIEHRKCEHGMNRSFDYRFAPQTLFAE